jgi:hypothetical protein
MGRWRRATHQEDKERELTQLQEIATLLKRKNMR